MQKLVFTNANGESIDFTDFENFGVVSWEGFDNVGQDVQSQTVPFHDGSVYIDTLLNDRDLSITVAINDRGSLARRYELRSKLISILNPKMGLGTLFYTNDYLSKQISVATAIPVFPTKNLDNRGTLKCTISFTANDPYWEDLDEKRILIQPYKETALNVDGDLNVSPSKIHFIYDSNLNRKFKIRNITNGSEFSAMTTNFNGSKPAFKMAVADLSFGKKTFKKEEIKFETVGQSIVDFQESDGKQFLCGVTVNSTKNFSDFETDYLPESNEYIEASCIIVNRLASGVAYGDYYLMVGGTKLKVCVNGTEWIELSKPDGTIGKIFYSHKKDSTYHLYMAIDDKIYHAEYSPNTYITYTELNVSGSNVTDFYVANISGNIYYCCQNGDVYFKPRDNNQPTLLRNFGVVLRSVYFDSEKNILIVAGDNATIYHTNDGGTTWVKDSFTYTPSTVCVNSIWYRDGVYYMCGENGLVATGLMGDTRIEWKCTNMGDYTFNYCRWSKLFGFMEFVGGTIVTYDGEIYKKINTYPKNITHCVKFKDKYYGSYLTNIYVSEDFKNWEIISFSTASNITRMETTGDNFFILCENGSLYYTADGTHFDMKPTTNIPYISEIHDGFMNVEMCYNNGEYIVEERGVIYTSPDGMTFTVKNSTLHQNTHIKIVNGKLIATYMDDGLWIWVSSDNRNFETHHTAFTENPETNIDYYNGNYVLAIDRKAYRTSDFENFTEIFDAENYLPEGFSELTIGQLVVLNGKLFVNILCYNPGTADYRTVLYSTEDFETYTERISNDSYSIINMFKDGLYYVAIPGGNNVITRRYNENFEMQDTVDGEWRDVDGNVYQIITDSESNHDIHCNGRYIGNFENYVLAGDIVLGEKSSDFFHTAMSLPYSAATGNLMALPFPNGFYYSDVHDGNLYANDSKYLWKITVDGDSVGLTMLFEHSGNGSLRSFCIDGADIYAVSKYRSLVGFDKVGDSSYSFGIGSVDEEIEANCCKAIDGFAYFGVGRTFPTYYSGHLMCVNLKNRTFVELDKDIEILDMMEFYHQLIFIGSKGIGIADEYRRDPRFKVTQFLNNRFSFYNFVREGDGEFVGLFNNFGRIYLSEGDNIIENVVDMGLTLSIGENRLVLSADPPIKAVLSFRNKYLGV